MADRYPLPVYYDFSSTICYVAHRVLGRLRTRIDDLGVVLQWRPVDLTRLTGWRRGARVAGPGRENALRVARELEVPVRMPGFWIDSRAAHEIAIELAADPVKEGVWRERVWSALYETGWDIGDPAVLERVAADVGIDARAAEDHGRIAEETARARELGVSAVPTFLVDRWPMGGIQDDASMTTFFERYVRKRRRERGLA